MPAEFSADEVIEITGGRLAQGMLPEGAGPLTTDTRSLTPGAWYLALSGERFDGHDFIGDAVAGGALGCIVAERGGYPLAETSFPLIAVGDTLAAYHALARNWRRRVNPIVVAVTGSSGKTTTKEMCASVLASGLRTHKSLANENNEYGVPKTLLSMPDDTQAVVVEMAMRGLGQIDLLAATAEADIGIVINVGVAHLELLGSVAKIAQAKCELLEHLERRGGVAIIGQPGPELMERASAVFSGRMFAFADGCLEEKDADLERTRFTVSGDTVFSVRAHGLSHLQDAWCAVTAGRIAGLTDGQIASGLAEYVPVEGRGNRILTADGALVIDETYNANPDSVRVSVDAFLDERANNKSVRYVVLGDLAELGEEGPTLHRDLGRWLLDKRLSGLITVGALARHIADGAQAASYDVIACRDQGEAEAWLRQRLSPETCVLVKGSHSANLDRLVALLAGT